MGRKNFMSLIETLIEPFIKDGVEYNTYPPPAVLLKVMERRWAEKLLAFGMMRFGSIESYRKWENKVLGDPNDGKGMFLMNGHQFEADSGCPVYAWCASEPQIKAERTLLLAEQGKYDCVVRLHEPLTLIQRVHAVLTGNNGSLRLHCSQASYNRGAEVDKRTLNSQKFHYNVFQKDQLFAPDMEYRLSLIDCKLRPEHKDHVTLEVGDCSDILRIEDLPNKDILVEV